ncbi:putative tRNA methyltransferase 10-like A isoform X1 [Apostichopus japonicus]|uniref:tRNA (guanine(9)-N(1))-methyltransferase n=1 Tax=Stichopus japonicus TaxID=307972 RepID=A0A2G8K1Z8_STIJA|nr:putative tRNA methyltransferase 10-like A isoform X1 [Apostichopus japonicus]
MENNLVSHSGCDDISNLTSIESRVPDLHPAKSQEPSLVISTPQGVHISSEKAGNAENGDAELKPTLTIRNEANVAGGQEVDKPVSKRQMKRMARHQKWLDLKPLRRQKQKEKMKDKKRKQKEERERLGIDEDSIRGPKLIKMSDPEASQVSIAIDCGFDHLMNDMEVRKVAKQIQRCYAANRRSPSPFQLHLCSFQNKTKSWFDGSIQGYSNWDVHIHDTSVEEAFPKEMVVYLSSESENILQRLDPSKAYIIGGLVDHNHQKGLCHQTAVEKGWQHAQLPITEFVEINGRKVLTINQVFEILLGFASTNNWKDSFYQVLPARKVETYAQDSSADKAAIGSEEREAGLSPGGADQERKEEDSCEEMGLIQADEQS